MPILNRADAEIYYEIHGAGFPILLYAPCADPSTESRSGRRARSRPTCWPRISGRPAH